MPQLLAALDYILPAVDVAASGGIAVSPLATRLISVLLSDEVVTEADWMFVSALFDTLVAGGLHVDDYTDTVDDLSQALVERAAPSLIESCLSILETVAYHYAPDELARGRLVGVIFSIFDRFSHRLQPDQLAILRIACRDLGQSQQADDLVERLPPILSTVQSSTGMSCKAN